MHGARATEIKSNSTRRDRVCGTLIGLAAGDRIGGPLRMALCLAESLVSQKRFDREDVLSRYLSWWRKGGFDSGPVSACLFDMIAAGNNKNDAVDRAHDAFGRRTAGCNPAHRSPPLSMAAFLSDEQLPALAYQEAALTHKDLLAGDAAAANVMLCRSLIRGMDWGSALRKAATGRMETTRSSLLNSTMPLNKDGYAPEVLHAAIFFVSTHSNFNAALRAALEFAGPENYCPVLVGAIGGARFGATAIPVALLSHCDIMVQVQTVAEELAGLW